MTSPIAYQAGSEMIVVATLFLYTDARQGWDASGLESVHVCMTAPSKKRPATQKFCAMIRLKKAELFSEMH